MRVLGRFFVALLFTATLLRLAGLDWRVWVALVAGYLLVGAALDSWRSFFAACREAQ